MNGDEVYPELIGGIEKIKNYRIAHGASLEQAKNEVYRDGALRRYRQITGKQSTKYLAPSAQQVRPPVFDLRQAIAYASSQTLR
jgi:hypothetical protein